MLPVLIATCAALPDGDEDAPALAAALTAAGVDARWVAWDDEHTRWDDSVVVLRSTWDYHGALPRFLDWIGGLPRVHNPAEVVGWNTDKTYLDDLARAGVPVVPSAFFAPGADLALPDAPEFVVKPTVGAGSRGVGRFAHTSAKQAYEHAAALHEEGRTVLVQPFLDGVDTAGETALLYLDGAFSHAIRKGPMLTADAAHPVGGASLYIPENISARVPDPAELEVGALALAVARDRFGDDLLYARVDLLPGPDGPVVTELELTEPSLFLGFDPDGAAADRLAAAIAARA